MVSFVTMLRDGGAPGSRTADQSSSTHSIYSLLAVTLAPAHRHPCAPSTLVVTAPPVRLPRLLDRDQGGLGPHRGRQAGQRLGDALDGVCHALIQYIARLWCLCHKLCGRVSLQERERVWALCPWYCPPHSPYCSIFISGASGGAELAPPLGRVPERHVQHGGTILVCVRFHGSIEGLNAQSERVCLKTAPCDGVAAGGEGGTGGDGLVRLQRR
mmetsp:Transcript_16023/g.51023  ORF Transcript_16023/g.51023 Transcript_16023/m.51023 type:complete len:214 (+) Transcript_16023:246-887(+)